MTVRKKRAAGNGTKARPSADTFAAQGAAGVSTDDALQERDRLIAVASDSFPGLLARVDRDLRYDFASHGYERILGASLRDIKGRTIRDVIGTAAYERAVPYVQRALAGERVTFENILGTPSGADVNVFLTFIPDVDARGTVCGLFIVALDTTERVRSEAALRESESYLRSIIELEPECVKLVSPDGRLMEMNPAGLAMLDVESLDEIRGGPLLDFVAPEHRAEFIELHRHVMGGGSGQLRFQAIGRKGTRRWLETHAVPYRKGQGEILGLLGITRDVTEHTTMQLQLQQAQKMESVGRLAGGIAHDFNNLLTVINTTAEIALMDVVDGEPLYDALTQIRSAADRAAALTRQLLAFARKQILKPVVLNINAVISDLRSMLERLVGEDIKLVWRPAADLKCVMADTSQVDQVLMNLVVNARDAMPDGGTLTITTANVVLDAAFAASHPSVVPGPHVMVSVSDTGHGMDQATIKHVFEPFFTTKGGLGTGLGLSTVYGIVKQSNGSVWVTSEPERGTTFTIYLPQAETGATPLVEKPAAASVRGTETILLVEDEDDVRKVAKRVLAFAGYSVLTASKGSEALELLRQHSGSLHLLLTDVIMPGMSGRDLADRVHEVRPDIRVLYLSGYADDALSRTGVLDEGIQFIAKPFAAADLMRKVRQVLDA
jgi:two-component system cell cycle sensor histidine kinase/response regulator CckA